MNRDLIDTTAIALCFEGAEQAQAPDWVQLTPAGPDIPGRDGRRWKLSRAQDVVEAFNRFGAKLPIDIEHATQVKGERGEPAPAIGYITSLEARNNALWGRAEWTASGRDLLAARGYAYLSPVFTFARKTGEIQRVVSAGLTNLPNLQLAALNRAASDPEEETPAVDKAILEALGLAEGASSADVLTAINTLQSDEATARNRAEHPDPGQFVPRADFDLAQTRLSELEAEARNRAQTEIETAVGDAIAAGKVAPASRDYHIAACKQEGGLERFEAFVRDAAPLISPAADRGTAQNKSQAGLSDEEIAVCRQLGMDPKGFAEAKSTEEL